MDFTVSPDNGEKSEFLPYLPPGLSHCQTLPLVYAASGGWGIVIFQSLQTEEFSLWHCCCFIKERVCLHIRAATGAIVLHLAFKNNFDITTPGPEYIQVKEEQFNFSYLPTVDIQLHFAPGEYIGLGICYSMAGLRQHMHSYAGLQAFLQQAEAGIASRLCPGYLYADPKMLATVNELLGQEYIDELGRMYIENEAWALLTLALRLAGRERDRAFVMTAADKARMEQVKAWLLAHPDDHGSLQGIARHFAMNEFRLKRDFKAVFGTTVFDYLLQARMQRAVQLLKETKLSIAEIAYAVGYSSGAHFSDAFRKRFGYPPNYLRRDRHSRL